MKDAREKAQQLLKTHNLKVTKGRVAVLVALMHARTPLAIDVIVRRVGSVNPTTVYRMLERFVAEGMIYHTNFRNGKAYFEYQPHHHHHITCTSCGKMEEIAVCTQEAEHRALKGAAHFTAIESHILEFFGRCRTCALRCGGAVQ